MEEIWKDIPNYEGLYQISNFGNVRRTKFINNIVTKDKITTTKINNNRYRQVCLCKNGKPKMFNIHRLVAEVFIDWRDFKKTNKDLGKVFAKKDLQINHKNENKHDNRVENLEWCTRTYNMNYGNVNDKISISRKKPQMKMRKPVIQYTKDMQFIKRYDGICTAVKETGIQRMCIINVCKNKQKTAGGFVWKYDI